MNKLKIALVTWIFCLLWYSSASAQDAVNLKKIESAVDKVIAGVYHASVRIAVYDSLKKTPPRGYFSGAVVSAEGHVLTAAHCTKPGEIYKVIFPDGQEQIAKGLGRIAIDRDSGGYDLAMIKILKAGKWTFAKMGSNANMKVGELCVGISYPGTYNHKLPNIRMGRLTSVSFKNGYFLSTSKMEPGDSGGALYNSNGELIGIHSYIKNSEEINFEAPVDLFKKYWTALNVEKDYEQLPQSDVIPKQEDSKAVVLIPPIQQLVKLSSDRLQSAVMITSKIDGKESKILGTLIHYGSASKNYIVSKSSLVGDDIKVKHHGGQHGVQVVGRDKQNDLVLLATSSKIGSSIAIASAPDSLVLSQKDLGDILITALGDDKQYVSVLSSDYYHAERSPGLFGANARFIDNKIMITQIMPRTAADGVLKLQDQITAINTVPTLLPADYNRENGKYLAGDSITVDVVREGKAMQLKMFFTRFHPDNHATFFFEGGISTVTEGFKKVLIHDGAIKASECGSPVFNRKGEFYGVNISRMSRTGTLIMPVSVIRSFLQRLIPEKA